MTLTYHLKLGMSTRVDEASLPKDENWILPEPRWGVRGLKLGMSMGPGGKDLFKLVLNTN